MDNYVIYVDSVGNLRCAFVTDTGEVIENKLRLVGVTVDSRFRGELIYS